MEGLIPLRNFAVLEENKLYRSAQPQYDYEYKWIAEKGIGIIVNLRQEAKIDQAHAPKYGIEVIQIDIKDHHSPRREEAELFMNVVRNTKQPLLFHCEHGRGRTSTFAVLARLAQGWKLEDALKEEKEKFGYEFAHADQINFLNSF